MVDLSLKTTSKQLIQVFLLAVNYLCFHKDTKTTQLDPHLDLINIQEEKLDRDYQNLY